MSLDRADSQKQEMPIKRTSGRRVNESHVLSPEATMDSDSKLPETASVTLPGVVEKVIKSPDPRLVKAGGVVSSARSLGVFCARATPASKTAIAKTSDKLFFIDFSLVRTETGRRSSGLVLRTGVEEELALTRSNRWYAVRIPKNLPG